MLLTYEHVLFNYASCEYVDMIQKIINKEIYANAKHKNGKMHMETTIMESFQYYSWYSNFILFLFFSSIVICIIFWYFKKLFKYHVRVICTKGVKEQMLKHVMSLIMI
jgi:hypothetical protein